MLTYNGTEISQSTAIARMIARQVKLAGNSNTEQAQVDMIVGCMSDFLDGNLRRLFLLKQFRKTKFFFSW